MDLSQIINRELYSFMGEEEKIDIPLQDIHLDEDYPKLFDMDEFKSLTSYAARKRYASQYLPKISSGSGRHVYIIDDNKVLKLAGNRKGLAQNEREVELSGVGWYDNITEVFEHHPQFLWIESERAKKITKNRFKQITGYDIEDVATFAKYREHEANGRGKYMGSRLDQETTDEMWEDSFTYNIAGMIGDYLQSSVDLDRISTYGEVNRDGNPEVVILDYGLSREVWDAHYEKKRQYEGDTNYEDELTNFVNPDEIKDGGYAGFALTSNDALLGDDLIKEDLYDEFKDVSDDTLAKSVKFIENLKDIGDMSGIYQSYMVSSRNIKRAVDMALNINRFYNNLMTIQNKLKGVGLIKEDLVYWHVGDGAKAGDDSFQMMSEGAITRYNEITREFADKMVRYLIKKFTNKDVTNVDYLGGGTYGFAYLFDGVVYKISTDKSEFVENKKIEGKTNQYLVDVYKAAKVTYNEKEYYLIIQEYMSTNDLMKYHNNLEKLEDMIKTYISPKENLYRIINEYRVNTDYYNDVYRDIIDDILEEVGGELQRFYYNLLNIADELNLNNIKSGDFINPDNLGIKKSGVVGFFDIGFGDNDEKVHSAAEFEMSESARSFNKEWSNVSTNELKDAISKLREFVDQNKVSYISAEEYDDIIFLTNILYYNRFKADDSLKNEIMELLRFGKSIMDKRSYVSEDGTSLYRTETGTVNANDVDMELQESEEKKPEKQKVGTLMVKFNIPIWSKILDKIKPEDVYHSEDIVFGLEEETHITILYGFNETVQPEDIMKELTDIELPIKAKLKGISLFNNPEFDVVKIDIDSPQLVELRQKVETLPNTLTYKDYVPHMTIGYLLRGRGQKYVHKFKTPIEIESSSIIYSDSERNQIELDFSPEIVEINENENINNNELNRIKDYLKLDKKNPLRVDDNNESINEEILTRERFSKIVKEMITEQNEITLQNLPFRKDIESLGGKMYAVGGAVRDKFIGKESKDLDILITGVPMDTIEKVVNRYGKVDAVGESFGVLKFIPDGTTDDVDIAIPRTEFATGDGGHKDFEVKSDHTLPIGDDLVRRDFTINAIARDIDDNIIDNHGGVDDIKNKIIRLVNPKAFADDPLRMLRGVGFASRFGFTIEPETMRSIQQNAPNIKKIASDRILEEFNKIVTKGDALIGAQLLSETGLLKQIFGNDVGVDTSLPWKNVRSMADFVFLLAKDNVENPSEFYLKNLISKDAKKNDDADEIKALDIAYKYASNDVTKNRMLISGMYNVSKNSVNSRILPKELHSALNDVIRGTYPKSVDDLAINGNDLMNFGLKQGRQIGNAKRYLLFQVYNDKLRNNKEELLAGVNKNDNNVDNSNIFNDVYSMVESILNRNVISETYSMVENLLIERDISFMPDSDVVTVNPNCSISGEGQSEACNQGEMKNLTLKKVTNEDDEVVNTKRPYYLKDEEPVRVDEVKYSDAQIMNIEKQWNMLDDLTKDDLKNIKFNLIDKRELSPQNSAILQKALEKNLDISKNNDNIDVSNKLGYYRGLWGNIGDPAKKGVMTSLYNKAQKKGELSKREYDELDYFLRNGRTRYNAGDLSKKYK